MWEYFVHWLLFTLLLFGAAAVLLGCISIVGALATSANIKRHDIWAWALYLRGRRMNSREAIDQAYDMAIWELNQRGAREAEKAKEGKGGTDAASVSDLG